MHSYEVNLKWMDRRKGILSSPVLPQKIEVATPPEFYKGMEAIWSPEHLFVAAINSCLMTTFISIAENSKLEYVSFDCNSNCIIDLVDGKYAITKIVLKPKLVIPYSQKPDKAKRVLEISKKSCLISNAVNVPIYLEPEVVVAESLICK